MNCGLALGYLCNSYKGEGTAEEQLKSWKLQISFSFSGVEQELPVSRGVAETWGEYRRGVVCRMLQAHVSVPHW